MTPDEIATLLIEQAKHTTIAQVIEEWRPQLTMDVLLAIDTLHFKATNSNAQQALQVVDIAEAVATILTTGEAQALAAWMRASNYLVLNRYQEAITCFQQLEPFYASRGDSWHLGGLQVNQVIALRDLGDYPAALALAQQARANLIAAGEKGELFLANLEVTLGWLYEEMGQPETALASYELGRATYLKLDRRFRAAVSDADRAHLLQTMDRFEQAEALLIEVRAVFVEGGYEQEVARNDLNLGILAYKRGHYQQALHYLEAANRGFAAIPLPIEVAVTNVHRSFVYRQLNLLEEVMHLAEQAGKVFKKEKMRREYVQCLINQAYSYQRLNLLPQAELLLAQARRLLYQNKAWGVLRGLDSDRAELALLFGRVDTARRLARRLEKQVALEERPSLAARVQLLLARCALAQRPADLDKARKYADSILAIAQRFHLPVYEAHAYSCLGQILEASGQNEAAWHYYQQAVQITEKLRTYLQHDEFQTGYMEDKLPVYAANVRLAHKMVAAGQASDSQLLQALTLAQTAPLLHLSDLAAGGERLNPAQQARLAELRQSWHWYQNKLDPPERLPSTSETETVGWREQLRQIEQEMNSLLHLGRKMGLPAGKAGASYEEPVSLLDSIQSFLGRQDVLLHFYEVEGNVQVVLVSQQEIRPVTDLVATAALERLLQTWRFYLGHASKTESTAAQQPEAAQPYLARFYAMLFNPLRPYLAGKERIYLVLPPDWHDVPMAALFDGNHYLVEQFQLIYLSTPTALLSMGQSASLVATAEKDLSPLVVGYSDGGRLPYTIPEARQVASTLSSTEQTTSLIEEEATMNQFRMIAPNSHLLHLATHALFRPDNPIFSSIQLADGRLTVADLYEMTLPGRPFVVLSACETGRGRARGGGLLGMGRGFLAAGAAGLIATLWPVQDAASASLIGDFYRAWLPLLSMVAASQALSIAQREAIGRGESPLQWAGFILIGG